MSINVKECLNMLEDKQMIIVKPALATAIGLNEAIILQQLNYWLNSGIAHEHDGKLWIYNTYEQWQSNFPFWSTSTIRRAIANLEGMGLIESGVYNKMKIDKTKWYTIPMNRPSAQFGQTIDPNWIDPSVQIEQTNNHRLPDTTTKINKSSNDDEKITAAIVDTLEKVGIGLNAYTVDKYMDLVQEFGAESTIRGILVAAENGKQNAFAYVTACTKNLANGTQPQYKNGNGNRNGTGNQNNTADREYTAEELGQIERGEIIDYNSLVNR